MQNMEPLSSEKIQISDKIEQNKITLKQVKEHGTGKKRNRKTAMGGRRREERL